MEHASFIIGSWVLTAASVVAYAVWMIARARKLSRHSDKKDLPWT